MAKKGPEFKEVLRTSSGAVFSRQKPDPDEGGFTDVARGDSGSISRRPEPAGDFEVAVRGDSGSISRRKK